MKQGFNGNSLFSPTGFCGHKKLENGSREVIVMSKALGWLKLPPPFSLPLHREVMFTSVLVKGQTLMHTFGSQLKYLNEIGGLGLTHTPHCFSILSILYFREGGR